MAVIARFAWWLAVPVVLIVPLLLSTRAGRAANLLREFSAASGLVAASLLLLSVFAASRVRSLTRAFGIEHVLLSHRWLGLITLLAVLLHVGLVVLDDPSRNIQLLLVKDAPPRARVATGATLCLMIICATSLLRRRIRLGYRTWRFIHITLAAAALILTGLHIYWLRHLVEDARMRNWYLVSTAILLMVLVNRWVLRPLRAAGADYVIEELRSESAAVTTVVLRPRHSWQRGLRFTAGQFAWLRIHGKYWDEHPFTIASSAEHPRRLEFTIRDVGTFTTRIPALQPGTRVRLDGPHGAFTVPAATTRPLLMIAGGVGITPMMSILRTMAHRGEQAPCLLVVGARREDELLFRDELHSLQSQLDLQVIEVLSEPPPGWTGSTGRVGEELISQLLPTRQLRNLIGLYVCGPSGMVASMRDIAVARGVPLERIHTEQFDMV